MNKKVSIDGKVALVTGANRGIGKAIVEELLVNNAKKVYAAARNTDSLKGLVEQYGERVVPVQLDITSDADIANLAEAATDVEILINNAGVIPTGNFMDGNLLGSLKANMDVNMWGMVKVTNVLVSAMAKLESGAIVSVSSVVGLGNMSAMLTYSVSKAALHSVIEGLRAELEDTNILVSGVYPGPIATDMTKDFNLPMETPQNVAKNIVASIEAGEEYIFPDPASKQIGQMYFTDPRAVTKQFSEMQKGM